MSEFDAERPISAEAAEIAALLERAVTGDAAAFEQIVMRTERRVLALASRLLGSMDDAQDAAQEVFIRAFKYLHRFDARKPIEPWLVGITVNVCRTIARKRQQYARFFLGAAPREEEFAETESSTDPHADLASREQRRALRTVLANLPEKERTALVLRDLEGLSTAEVAGILGSSEATVRAQISSARVKIKKAFDRMKGGRP